MMIGGVILTVGIPVLPPPPPPFRLGTTCPKPELHTESVCTIVLVGCWEEAGWTEISSAFPRLLLLLRPWRPS